MVVMEMVTSCTSGLLHFNGISSPVVVTLLATTLLVTLLVSITQLLERKKLPPGPTAWPVVGNFPALGGALPHRVLRRLANKYGGLMYLRLGSTANHISLQTAHYCILFA